MTHSFCCCSQPDSDMPLCLGASKHAISTRCIETVPFFSLFSFPMSLSPPPRSRHASLWSMSKATDPRRWFSLLLTRASLSSASGCLETWQRTPERFSVQPFSQGCEGCPLHAWPGKAHRGVFFDARTGRWGFQPPTWKFQAPRIDDELSALRQVLVRSWAEKRHPR